MPSFNDQPAILIKKAPLTANDQLYLYTFTSPFEVTTKEEWLKELENVENLTDGITCKVSLKMIEDWKGLTVDERFNDLVRTRRLIHVTALANGDFKETEYLRPENKKLFA